MSETQIQIRLMTARDIETVARLHRTCFPNSRSSMLGLGFTRAMYQWFLVHQGALATICQSEGEVAGFMTGAIGGYGRRLFGATWPLIAWGLITHPRLWLNPNVFKLWHSYLKGLVPWRFSASIETKSSNNHVKASVAGIAVVEHFRGRGIAQILLQDFEARAMQLGATCFSLSVLNDNIAARRSYERAGWQLVNSDDHNGSYYAKDAQLFSGL